MAGTFDTLICLVSNNEAVLNTLSQKGQYTVFAPTDAAFSAIGITGANCAGLAPAVTPVLLYHVAHGRRDAATVVVDADPDAEQAVRHDLGVGGRYYVNDAAIVATDVFASNGGSTPSTGCSCPPDRLLPSRVRPREGLVPAAAQPAGAPGRLPARSYGRDAGRQPRCKASPGLHMWREPPPLVDDAGSAPPLPAHDPCSRPT